MNFSYRCKGLWFNLFWFVWGTKLSNWVAPCETLNAVWLLSLGSYFVFLLLNLLKIQLFEQHTLRNVFKISKQKYTGYVLEYKSIGE